MVIWYIVSAIFLVIAAVTLIRGVYLLCRGIRQKDIEDIAYAAVNLVCVGLIVLFFGVIDSTLGFDLRWIKIFVAEHAVSLKIIAGILFCTVGVPFIGVCLALMKWLFIDTRKKIDLQDNVTQKDK